MIVGQITYLLGIILAAARPPDSIYWTFFFFSVIVIVVGLDSSLTAAIIIFSNVIPQRYQGMGASIAMTVVNYSISLGLGFAGTIETNINHGGITQSDKLLGYRGALWFGVGLSGLGLVLSVIFEGKGRWKSKPNH